MIDTDFNLPGQSIVNTIFGALLSVVFGVSDVFKPATGEELFCGCIAVALIISYGASLQITFWSISEGDRLTSIPATLFTIIFIFVTFFFIRLNLINVTLHPNTSSMLDAVTACIFALWLASGVAITRIYKTLDLSDNAL